MSDLVGYLVRGIPFGCVYALVAVGLVLAYRTSGVFNLALAAQAYLSAALFYQLRVRSGWPLLPAFVVAALIISPLVGLLLERTIFRPLRAAPPIARLVATTGILVALPALVKIVLGSGSTFAPPVLWPDPAVRYSVGPWTYDAKDAAVIVATLASLVVLGALFRFTPFGLLVKAVVESPKLTGLTGVNPNRVSATSWAVSSAFAGVAGVLISPLFAQVLDQFFFNVLVAAIACAVFGRLASLPLAFVGGLILGAAQGVLAGYLPADSTLANGLRPALPFVALFLLLLFWPGLRRREADDPLAGTEPPVGFRDDATAGAPPPSHASRLALGLMAVGAVALIGYHYPERVWLSWGIEAAIFTTIFLSITLFTGLGGQLSLCTATFAAIGAFTTAQLASNLGVSVLIAMVVGAVVAAALGVALAIPTLRLSGVFLALATLAFALMFQSVIQPLSWVSGGGPRPIAVPRAAVGSLSFENDRLFFALCVVVAVVVGLAVVSVRRGTTGQYLEALRGSEPGAQAIGINPRSSRVVAFALSAAVAAIGGSLLAQFQGAARVQDFDPILGLLWVATVVTLGARSIEGAVNAAIGLKAFTVIFLTDLIPWAVNSAQPWLHLDPLPVLWASVIFGFGAVSYARNPDGILAASQRHSASRRARRAHRARRSDGLAVSQTVGVGP
jgi:branched-chain amino acid transport system permease protein